MERLREIIRAYKNEELDDSELMKEVDNIVKSIPPSTRNTYSGNNIEAAAEFAHTYYTANKTNSTAAEESHKRGKETDINHSLRDSVFRLRFNDEKVLLDVYNALHGTNYGTDTKIELATIQDMLFLENIKNDASFYLDDRLVIFIEHQSTVCNNMPLRFLHYASVTYKQLVPHDLVFKRNLIEIPAPEFVVLYNGKQHMEDIVDLKLSDAFKEKSNNPLLELKVRVYNINKGHNEGILRKCKYLQEYAMFIDEVFKRLKSGMAASERKNAVYEAIRYCIENNIMREFLMEHEKEVLDMLVTEVKFADLEESIREEGIEEGIEKGIEKVALEMLREGFRLQDILKATKLSEDKIRSMVKQHNIVMRV
jgi:predicted transposase/invertase (TIGR01784 family)